MVGCLVPRIASGHTPGLSTAVFEADEATGRVDARFVFASSEPLGNLPIDRDGDGVVTEADLQAAREDLRAFLADGVEVSGDGTRCPATFTGASLGEVDGLVLTSTFACPRHASSLEAILYYLSALPPGHREVVRMTAGSATAEAALSSERRALSLKLPVDPAQEAQGRARRDRAGRRLVALTAAFAAFMLSIFVWRWRTAPRRTSASSSLPPH